MEAAALLQSEGLIPENIYTDYGLYHEMETVQQLDNKGHLIIESFGGHATWMPYMDIRLTNGEIAARFGSFWNIKTLVGMEDNQTGKCFWSLNLWLCTYGYRCQSPADQRMFLSIANSAGQELGRFPVNPLAGDIADKTVIPFSASGDLPMDVFREGIYWAVGFMPAQWSRI